MCPISAIEKTALPRRLNVFGNTVLPTGEASMGGPLGPELWRLRREDLLREAEQERLARSLPRPDNGRPWLRPLKRLGRLLASLLAGTPAAQPAGDLAPDACGPARRVPAHARRCGRPAQRRAA